MAEQRWIRKRPPRRHDCKSDLPSVPTGNEHDMWICPTCRRRWDLAYKQDPDGLPFGPCFSEGYSIKGPDGSVYWRPFLARGIGRLQL